MEMDDRLAMIQDMLKKDPTDDFLNYALALEYYKVDQLNNAIETLEKLAEQSPDYLGTYYQLGQWYEELEAFEKAIAIYKAGKAVAEKQNDQKTLGELEEALMFIDDWE